jgi:DNA-binding HxlR family transcriptional regulator
MNNAVIEEHTGCIAFAAQILGDKWNPLIIKNLCERTLRFSEIQRELKINPRTLSARLDLLEKAKIITRTVFAEVPPRVDYAVTEKGRDLIPVFHSMAEWGEKYRGDAKT